MPTGTKNEVVPLVCRLELLWSQGGVLAANVLHFVYSGDPPSPSDCASLAGQIANPIWTAIRADYPGSTTLVAAVATDLNTIDGAVGSSPIGTSGTAEDSASPAQCCVLVDWQISRRYRGGHPRTYFPAVAFGSIFTPSSWNPDIIPDFTTALNTTYAGESVYESGTTIYEGLVNVSYSSGGAYRVDNVVDTLLSFSVSTLIRTQRRRVTATSY